MKTKLLAPVCAAIAALSAIAAAPVQAAEGQTVQQMRQAIPLSLGRVAKVLGQPGVYIFDCNPEDIYEQSHLKGAIKTNVVGWEKLLPEDKKNTFLIFYCINRLCNVSFEISQVAINMGYENVYLMPDGIQGWVQHGYEFEGTGRQDPGIAAAKARREAQT